MLTPSSSIKLAFYARLALILHAILLILFLLYIGRPILIPLFFSFLSAILLYPFVLFLERKHIRRTIACLIAVLMFVIFIAGLVSFFSLEIARFSKDLPHLKERFSEMLENVRNWISYKYNIDDSSQKDYINRSSNDLMSQAISSIGTTFLGIIELLIVSVFCFIFTFFILFYRDLLMKFLLSFFKSNQHEKVKEVITKTRVIINNYVAGLFIEMLALILIGFPALAILGIKYALVLSVMAAVLNIIPYLGIYTAAAISMLITFTNGTGNQALEVGITFIIIHVIDANVLLPHIIGGRVKMNPFITLIAVFTGNLLWGIPGMFLFIPLTAIFRIISEAVVNLKPWAILLGEEKRE